MRKEGRGGGGATGGGRQACPVSKRSQMILACSRQIECTISQIEIEKASLRQPAPTNCLCACNQKTEALCDFQTRALKRQLCGIRGARGGRMGGLWAAHCIAFDSHGRELRKKRMEGAGEGYPAKGKLRKSGPESGWCLAKAERVVGVRSGDLEHQCRRTCAVILADFHFICPQSGNDL